MYQMSQEEKEYLKQYDITKFDRPSVAADMAVFTVMGDPKEEAVRDKGNYRKLPEKKLKLLLIKRGSYPYKDRWALPGGFCRKGEEVSDTAKRELFEETQVGDAYLQLAGVFGEEGRDPRGWIISHTFLALFDGRKCRLRAGSDAWDARWFDVELVQEQIEEQIEEQFKEAQTEKKQIPDRQTAAEQEAEADEKTTARKKAIYRLVLTNNDEDEQIRLEAVISQEKNFLQFQVNTDYRIETEEGFAFDHAKLITYALLHLRKQAETDGRIVFDLMPEYFTLTELQNACEIILGKELLAANFRRKMADYVVETDKMSEGAGHRPAKLFKRNLQSIFME
ncbi:MAG: NUDIX hydrolase [Lachnospiraceae bacterium]|nr:NUDIX hydrolase [Lachnospiraceae bacterium]